jgi:crotonobetainyl-CoA:carnitine CoA-transferase CaiB-like acyl-CoA transferase
MSGMYASVASLAALARREVSGHGEYVDIAMLDVGVAMLSNQGMNYLTSGTPPRRTGTAHPNVQPQDVFACRDGQIVLAVGNDGQFAKLCAALGRGELAQDARFAKNAGRVRNQETLMPMLRAELAKRDRKSLVEALERAGVPCGPINSIPEVFDEPQVKHRKMRVDVPHPLSGTVSLIASPMRFTHAPLTHDRPPPLLGEHTADILHELGFDDAKIAQLKRDEII